MPPSCVPVPEAETGRSWPLLGRNTGTSGALYCCAWFPACFPVEVLSILSQATVTVYLQGDLSTEDPAEHGPMCMSLVSSLPLCSRGSPPPALASHGKCSGRKRLPGWQPRSNLLKMGRVSCGVACHSKSLGVLGLYRGTLKQPGRTPIK